MANMLQMDLAKPSRDDRNYRFIQLDNDLKVVVVSDPTTEKAAAALSVRVGYLCDPPDVQGLAHFCEHMLFLGTQKYPKETEYTEFLHQHGGTFNACTSVEYTTYFFDVANEHLQEGLDRFAQFFVGPLFNEDSKDRELNAVESEHSKNQFVDGWRLKQLHAYTAKPGHPYSKFGTGNKYTLQVRPTELGIDVRNELLQFHSKYYSSNLMALTVLGRGSLDELTNLVKNLFMPVVNKRLPVLEFSEHPLSSDELQMWIEVVPVKEMREIRLEFPIPDFSEHYKANPLFYVAHLLGHEGQGSILSYMKMKGWCNTLVAGPSDGAKGFAFFILNMELTEKGESHLNEIVMAVFQFINMLREEGPKQWIYQECADQLAMEYQFKDKENPRRTVEHLVRHIHEYPSSDVLSGAYLMSEFRPDLINLVMEKLRPQYLRVFHISKKFEGLTTQVEPWYGVKYTSRKIEQGILDQWSEATPISQLHLPPVNEFIPTNFDQCPVDNAIPYPTLIKNTDMSRVWFQQDTHFLLPKAGVYFMITTPAAYKDPTSWCLTLLFVQMLKDAVNEYAYNAEIAGISYTVSVSVYGIKIEIFGFQHKQPLLLDKLVSRMANFTVDEGRFAVNKNELARQLRNFRTEQPFQHALYYMGAALDNWKWTVPEVLAVVDAITSEQLQGFIPVLLSAVKIEALLAGNLTKEQALGLVTLVENTLKEGSCNSRPVPESEIIRHREIQLPAAQPHLYCTQNEVHPLTAIEIYFQIGTENLRDNVLLELLNQTMAEPCFNILRTKEQLGYIVGSGVRRGNGAQGLRVVIQSVKDPEFLQRRVEVFLVRMRHVLQTMSPEEFQKHVAGLAVKRLEKPKNLKDQCQKYWDEILSYQYHFNRDEAEVAFLKTVKKEDVITFFDDHIGAGGVYRRQLSVHVVPSPNCGGNGTSIGLDEADGEEEVGGEEEDERAVGTNEDKTSTSDKAGTTDEIDGPLDIPKPTIVADLNSFKAGLGLLPLVQPFTAF